MRSALDRGLVITAHCDSPIVPADPLLSIWVSVNRPDILWSGPWSDQRISVLEALRAHTFNPAWQNFQENAKGSIEPCKLADLVVLDANRWKSIRRSAQHRYSGNHCRQGKPCIPPCLIDARACSSRPPSSLQPRAPLPHTNKGIRPCPKPPRRSRSRLPWKNRPFLSAAPVSCSPLSSCTCCSCLTSRRASA